MSKQSQLGLCDSSTCAVGCITTVIEIVEQQVVNIHESCVTLFDIFPCFSSFVFIVFSCC